MNITELLAEAGWQPGLGDPSPAGYLTVAAYFVTGLLCCWNAWHVRRSKGKNFERRVWFVLALIFVFFGFQKAINFFSFLTALLSALAYRYDLYNQRRLLQAFVLGAVLLLAVLWIWRALSSANAFPIRLAMAGTLYLFVFVTVRAASFHPFDVFINVRVLGLRVNWILELGGIFVAAIAILSAPRSKSLVATAPD